MSRSFGLIVVAALIAAACSTGCGDGATGPVLKPPQPSGSIPSQTLIAGDSVTVYLDRYFTDPDGDLLTFSARVSDPRVATVAVSGDTLTVTGYGPGSTLITATASDSDSLSSEQVFEVTVSNPPYEPLHFVTMMLSGIRLGIFPIDSCTPDFIIFDDVRYDIHWTEVQRLTDSGWVPVPGTRRDRAICGHDLTTLPAGEYRLAGEMSVEGVHGHFTSADTVTIGSSDLAVVDPSPPSIAASVGDEVRFSFTVRNNGTVSSGETTARVKYSRNATITTSDSEAGSRPMRPLEGRSEIEFTGGLEFTSAGDGYLGVCVDAVAGESNTSNNCSPGIRVSVSW